MSLLLYQLRELDHEPLYGSALDFGCGVGRLTQALADHFTTVIGVDVSPTMLQLASKLNRHDVRVTYVRNQAPDLSRFLSNSFDFVYSDIVLQHIEPEMSLNYLREFVRLLRPGGVAVFQLPSHLRPETPICAPRAMPDVAYRIRLEIPQPLSMIAPGTHATIPVHATNVSPVTWPAQAGEIRIGNHWLNAETGAMLVQDDGRAALPRDLAPGRLQVVMLTIAAPKSPGVYICEIDAVHEGLTWFADKDSVPARFHVTVPGSSASRSAGRTGAPAGHSIQPGQTLPDIYADLPSNVPEPGDFPMFGVPQEIVRDTIGASGSQLFLQEPDERCGREWIGFRYFIEKRR